MSEDGLRQRNARLVAEITTLTDQLQEVLSISDRLATTGEGLADRIKIFEAEIDRLEMLIEELTEDRNEAQKSAIHLSDAVARFSKQLADAKVIAKRTGADLLSTCDQRDEARAGYTYMLGRLIRQYHHLPMSQRGSIEDYIGCTTEQYSLHMQTPHHIIKPRTMT